MGTEARHACPVCSEPYAERAEQCFRCETPLGAWWRFEEATRGLAPATRSPRRSASVVALAVAALVGAGLAGARLASVWTRIHPAREVSRATLPVASSPVTTVPVATAPVGSGPSASGPVVAVPGEGTAQPEIRTLPPRLTYRVQRGDSLWRIAAALTGDGRKWSSLWPSRDPATPLAVGTVLEVPGEAAGRPRVK